MEAEVKAVLNLLGQGKIDRITASRLIDKLNEKKAFNKEEKVNIASESVTNSSDCNCDLAIIGMSGKFPGANDINEFWSNIKEGIESIDIVPVSRWDWQSVPNSKSKWGGFINDVSNFDAGFFNYSPNEAECMDPQHRLLLEESWKCIESAGYNPHSLSNTQCGVYVGVMNHDYFDKLMFKDDQDVSAWELMGNSSAILASRVSYFLNLKGPAIAIDTACSSSLVATHIAAKALRNKEIDMALVGGVTLYLTPRLFKLMSKANMLSPTGACKTFDNKADGIVVGEAAVFVALKRLTDAERDGDNILSVVKGTGTNQDGKTNGITAPSGLSQTALLNDVYTKAKISPSSVSYVEAHGTGTKLGDPIEFNALSTVFSIHNDKKNYCALGSVKSNIGHTSAASGLVSLIKCTMALNNEVIPPSLHYKTPNEHINVDDSPFFIPTVLTPWLKKDSVPRIAGLSSFGFSGTNAHVIIQEYEKNNLENKLSNLPAYLFCFSAKSKESLHRYIYKFQKYLNANNQVDSLANISYTLLTGRSHFKCRIAFIASSINELEHKLTEYLVSNNPEDLLKSQLQYAKKQKIFKGAVELNQLLKLISIIGKESDVNKEKYTSFLEQSALLYLEGNDTEWLELFSGNKYKRIQLPTYSFDSFPYWFEQKNKAQNNFILKNESNINQFIDSNDSTFYEQKYSKNFYRSSPSINDHLINGKPTLAGAFIIGMAIESLCLASNIEINKVNLQEIRFIKPVIFHTEVLKITVLLLEETSGQVKFDVIVNEDNTDKFAVGKFTTNADSNYLNVSISNLKKQTDIKISGKGIYDIFDQINLKYGPSFQRLKNVHCAEDYYVAELVELKNEESTLNSIFNPFTLDASMHAIGGLKVAINNRLMIPSYISGLRILEPFTGTLYAYGRVLNSKTQSGGIKYSLSIVNDKGSTIATAEEINLISVPNKELNSNNTINYYNPFWNYTEDVSFRSSQLIGNTSIWADLTEEQYEAIDLKQYQLVDAGSLTPDKLKQEIVDSNNNNVIIYINDVHCLEFESVAQFVFAFFQTLVETFAGKSCNIVIGYKPMNDISDIEFKAIHSFLKSVVREYPSLKARLVELDYGNNDKIEIINTLLGELTVAEPNFYIKYNLGNRYEQTISNSYLSLSQESLTLEGGVYLITGGMGKLGQVFAKSLINKGAKSILLVGRKKMSRNEVQDILGATLTSNKCSIDYIACDITDEYALIQLRENILKKFGKLNGIIQCSGLTIDSLLGNKTADSLKKVIVPKLQGTILLDKIFSKEDLLFFVLFSSIASLIGNAGQVDYAYANACLDEFSNFRNQLVTKKERKGKTIAINWPLWEAGGMTTSVRHFAAAQKDFGLEILTEEHGIKAFYNILNSNLQQVAPILGNKSKLFFSLNNAQYNINLLIDEHNSKAPNNSKSIVIDDVKMSMANTLKISASDIFNDRLLEEYGIDSISMMDIIYQLEHNYGKLPQTLFFECKTVNDLADYIVENCVDKFTPPNTINPNEYINSINNDNIISDKNNILVENKGQPVDQQYCDDIAIIGIAGKYPKSDNINELWDNLLNATDCIEEIPVARWDFKKFYERQSIQGGKAGKWGGFINNATSFDSLFFNISPKEAALIDPQERVFLETCWHALENAGYTRERLNEEIESNVGVFVGAMNHDFTYYNIPSIFEGSTTGYGSTIGSVANRVSYCLNLRGPSMVVDTMCSSSVTSLQLACESIKRGECKMAIAGGVNLILHPVKYAMLANAHFLSSEGKCRSFGEGGDGYVPGEGAGAVLLKPLSQAIKDKDYIWGTIKSVSINHNGKSHGFTVPSPQAQAQVIEQAIRSAKIDVRQLKYIEAHGTGTSLGDPIEISGLEMTFKKILNVDRIQGIKYLLGSIKSNIGHLEAAAGIAGLTKILLQFHHKKFVPSLHSQKLNSKISAKADFIDIVQEVIDFTLPQNNDYFMGLSSFGAGGSNAHMIVKGPPVLEKSTVVKNIFFIPFSAKTISSLIKTLQELYKWFSEKNDLDSILSNIEYTLCVGREQMNERITFIVRNAEELLPLIKIACSNLILNNQRIYIKQNTLEQFSEKEINGYKMANSNETLSKWYNNDDLYKLAQLWCSGMQLPWKSIFSEKRQHFPLPGYSFDIYDFPLPSIKNVGQNEIKREIDLYFELHPAAERSATMNLIKINISSVSPYFKEHVIEGRPILSAACQIEIIQHALNSLKIFTGRVTEVILLKTIIAKELDHLYITIEEGSDRKKISISTYRDGVLNPYTTAIWTAIYSVDTASRLDTNANVIQVINSEEIYLKFKNIGVEYGSHYKSLSSVSSLDNGTLLATVNTINSIETSLLPTLIDAGFQALIGINISNCEGFYYPISFDYISNINELHDTHHIYISDIICDEYQLSCSLTFCNEQNVELGKINNLKGLNSTFQTNMASNYTIKDKMPSETEEDFNVLLIYIQDLLCSYLELSKDKIGFDTHFEAFGINSIMILELTSRLENKFGPLPKTLFFECQTINELVLFLAKGYETKTIILDTQQPYNTNTSSLDFTQDISKDQNLDSPVVDSIANFNSSHDNLIAIIGIDGQFPMAENLDEYWQNLVASKDCVTKIPSDRKGFSDSDKEEFSGGFLKDIESFDALFFNIAPTQAQTMDPQERLMLETAWKTIEDANYTRKELKNESVGVYIGAMYSEYQLYGPEVSKYSAPVALSGTQASIANRISSVLDLDGPSMTIDTMCSSALSAIHLACNSIHSKECTMALAGGVNLLLHPNKYTLLLQGNFLSPDGKCRSFGIDGKGYVPSEGVGCVLLKPYSKAVHDNDHIYGVINSTAINHGGKTSGYTVPNLNAQQKVIEQAINKAGISPDIIDYIEAHGTGTALGDPIEIKSLTKAYKELDKRNICSVGSVKSNIGHCESAAGMAGLFKILLQFKYQYYVPTIHTDILNPDIDFKSSPFYVQKQLQSFSNRVNNAPGEKRYAALSSFGAGGSNAHFILSSHLAPIVPETAENTDYAIVLSAKSSNSLKAQTKNLLVWLETQMDSELQVESSDSFAKFQKEIIAEIALVIHTSPDDLILDQTLDSCGIDIVSTYKLKEQFEDKIGIPISENIFSNNITIGSLTNELFRYANSKVSDYRMNLVTVKNHKDKVSNICSLRNISYSLQKGRENKAFRLAITCRSKSDLKIELKKYLDEVESFDSFIGCTKDENKVPIELNSINSWVHQNNIRELCLAWTKGYEVPWHSLYTKTPLLQSLPLPTTVFDKRKYWVKGWQDNSNLDKEAKKSKSDVTSKLLQENLSNSYIQRYKSTFLGEEFFLRDHIINGISILPGSAYIEMIYQAAKQYLDSSDFTINNIVWLQPFELNNEHKSIIVDLVTKNDIFALEIWSTSGITEERIVHCQAKVSKGIKQHKQFVLNFQQFDKLENSISVEKIYAGFEKANFEYGPSFRLLKKVNAYSNQALAFINNTHSDNYNLYDLHPAILDSCFQACSALCNSQDIISGETHLPFSIKRVVLYKKIPNAIHAHIQSNKDKNSLLVYDIFLLDEEKNIIAYIEDFTLRKLVSKQKNLSSHSSSVHSIINPFIKWNKAVIYKEELIQKVELLKNVWIYHDSAIAHNIIKHRFEGAVINQLPVINLENPEQILSVFEDTFKEVKKILLSKGREKNKIIFFLEYRPEIYNIFSGLLKTATIENPFLQCKIVYIDSVNSYAVNEISNILDEEIHEIKYADIVRYKSRVREIQTLEINIDANNNLPIYKFRENGVYWILGGLGGLGKIIAEHISKQVNCTIILSGRKKLDSTVQYEIDTLGIKNGNFVYIPCDLTSAESIVQTFKTIKSDYGKLNGIIHSAGISKDSFIIKKDINDLKSVMSSKITGTIFLDKITSEEKLDFFCLFSSLASINGNFGQSDYASANAFLDQFAFYRNKLMISGLRHGHSLSINWPLWREGGMGVEAEVEEWMIKKAGLLPLTNEEGTRAFDQALASNLTQIVVSKISGMKAYSFLKINTDNHKTPSEEIAINSMSKSVVQQQIAEQSVGKILKEVLMQTLQLQDEDIDVQAEFADFGVDSIQMISILSELEEKFNTTFDPNTIIQYSTFTKLVNHITSLGILKFSDSNQNYVNINEFNSQVISEPSSKTATTENDIVYLKQNAVYKEPNFNNSANKIAIIGCASRFPKSPNPESFWDNLAKGEELISEIPKERWSLDGFYDSENEGLPNSSYSKHAGFMDEIEYFDPNFFNISEANALVMDPQHRIMLELSQELFDRTGYSQQELRGSKTSVYIGAKEGSYLFNNKSVVTPEQQQHMLVNSLANMIAARISNFYDLRGASKTIDTACSSSLVATHDACRSLISGEVDMAVAGGIFLLQDSFAHISFSQARVLSPDGHSYVFDKRAKGFILGEGAGLILLKRYDDAIRDGDQIEGIICASSVNNDGYTMGVTTPNHRGQKDVIVEAIEASKIDPRTISYYEVHGTGTLLGDPIEIKAATEAYRTYTTDKGYCAVGSVKSNMGHAITAAGMAGLIKILLSMKNRKIPPTLNCEHPHPRFRFEDSPFYPNTSLRDWEPINGIRRAALSSFGFGGTNAHLIIEEAPEVISRTGALRQSLPVTKFKKKYYWLGKSPNITEKNEEAEIRNVLNSLISNNISIEDACKSLK